MPPIAIITNVLDIYYQDNQKQMPNFAQLKALHGIMAVLHKASQGQHFRDPLYKARRAAAEAAGLLWGAYHFLDSSDPALQAANFLAAAEFNAPGKPVPLLIADYEENGANTCALHQCQAFLRIVDSALQPYSGLCAIYSSNLIRETLRPQPAGHIDPQMIGTDDFFAQHPLYLAEYGPKEQIPWPWKSAFLWQTTDQGRFKEIIGKVDCNFFDGDRDALAKFWPNGGGIVPTVPGTDVPSSTASADPGRGSMRGIS